MGCHRASAVAWLLVLLTACGSDPDATGMASLDAALPADAGAADDLAQPSADTAPVDAGEAGVDAPADGPFTVDVAPAPRNTGDGGCGVGPGDAAPHEQAGPVAISLDGEVVAAAYGNVVIGPGRILLWWRYGTRPPLPLDTVGYVMAMQFRPDGSLLVQERRPGKRTVVLRAPPDYAPGAEWSIEGPLPERLWAPLAVSPDGETVVLGDEPALRLRRVRDGTIQRSLPQPSEGPSFSADGERLASIAGGLKVWRLADGQPMALPPPLENYPAFWASLPADLVAKLEYLKPEVRRISDGSLVPPPPAPADRPTPWTWATGASPTGRFLVWRGHGSVSWFHPYAVFDRLRGATAWVADSTTVTLVFSPDESFLVHDGTTPICLPP